MKNCLTYALSTWHRDGGYLLVRRSLAARMFGIRSRWHPVMWVPHFLHMSREGVITQYVPTEETVAEHQGHLLSFWLGLWHFDGRVITGDFECRLHWRRARGEDPRVPTLSCEA